MKQRIKIKYFLFSTLLLFLFSCNPVVQKERTNVVLPIIPQPKMVQVYDGSFALDSMTQLVFSTDEQQKIANYFNRELKKLAGFSCRIQSASKEKKLISFIQVDSLAKEAYLLDIDRARITVKASAEAGYFYAVQTLLQLAPITEKAMRQTTLSFSQLSISDEPRFKWRGALLDVSRHFFGPAAIKKLIDQMAAQKMNRLHLHLTDDPGWRIEIKEYPKLVEIGSHGDRTDPDGPAMYLTENEAREITAYANDRQITIVPEVDIPGHSGAVSRAYPEFSGGNNTLNIANPEAIKMMETVILRLADIFNTSYIHFGSDEVRHHNWEGRPDMKARMMELGLKDQREFEGWFDRKMADYIVQSGLNPVAWDEAFDFGVNKSTIIQWWRGEYPEVLKHAAEQGYDIILSPVDFLYLDYPSDLKEGGANWEGLHNGANSMEAIYTWNPIPKTFNDAMAARVIGMEAGIWTEFIADEKRLEYMVYPRLAGVAEKAWTQEGNLNWDSFRQRLSVQYKRYDRDSINYRIPNLGVEERKVRQPEAFLGPIPD